MTGINLEKHKTIKTNDPVNHPSHYTRGKIEVIDFIEDQKLGYKDGNVVKYVCRFRHKGKPLEDLKKARWYLDRLIENWKGGVPVKDIVEYPEIKPEGRLP